MCFPIFSSISTTVLYKYCILYSVLSKKVPQKSTFLFATLPSSVRWKWKTGGQKETGGGRDGNTMRQIYNRTDSVGTEGEGQQEERTAVKRLLVLAASE